MSNRLRLTIDAVTFLSLLLANSPAATGIAIHEWLSVALALTLFVHLVLNWGWCARTATRLFRKMMASRRINFAVDLVLLVAFVTVMLTGILISESVLPTLGITVAGLGVARTLHALSADATILAFAVHLGMHWRWIFRVLADWFSPSTRTDEVVVPARPAMERSEA
ncbi:MAG: DUF4405 domain-containing protein [Coriobacteriia bacterium]|nr:DUF4405 domain-containing protein [Coriobacteriia bacterium]